MRQFHWGRKAEFPYTKVFVLGILLTVLGSACIVVSVIGIVQLAWGYYVSTGMWGGVAVTLSGLSAMYAARAQSSLSARLYFSLSLLTCLVSFAMIVLSAGGLTYKSNFYQPMRFDIHRHQVTLFLHGSVLGVGVLSLACNVLSVIVCCKFIIHEKDRGEESIKLRRRRHRLSDAHRGSAVRGGSGAVRTSTSSRTPLFGSERSRKHLRQTSESDSTNLKISSERTSHRRDSDRSKGSSRSRHSHHRQSSSVSQQSRNSAPMEAEVTTVLLRDTEPNFLCSHRDRPSSHSTTDNPRDSQADTLTDNMSVQLVFDPDEEPLPPYEEARPVTLVSTDGNETETETVDGSSNVVVPSCLPLNIPVTRLGACQIQTLQGQPPPMSPSRSQQRRGHHADDITTAMERTTLESSAFSTYDQGQLVSVMRTAQADHGTKSTVSPDHQPVPQARNSSDSHPTEDGSASPEICALTGERMTPVAAVQPDTVTGNSSVFTSCVAQHNPSPDSSDTSFAGDALVASQVPVLTQANSGTVPPASSNSSSALPAGIHSPSSAFRPVGKRVVPLAQASPSHSVPVHNLFSPITAPGSAHHTVYSPVASPSAANRFVSPASPHHANHSASSSESLSRGTAGQPLSWKKIPLPSSHNHSNRTSSVPFKEVTSKTIPGPSQPIRRDKDAPPHSLPRQSSRRVERKAAVPNVKRHDSRNRAQFVPLSAAVDVSADAVPQEQSVLKVSDDGPFPEKDACSAFVKRQPGAQVKAQVNVSAAGVMDSPFIAFGNPVRGSVDCAAKVDGLRPVKPEVNRPQALTSHSTKNVDSHHAATVEGHAGDTFNHAASTGNNHLPGSQPVPMSSQFRPIGNQPVTTGGHAVAASKQQSAFGSPGRAPRGQVVETDPNRRSAGCQATDDGGIASSMDRTHRWVMGTLPSGTRYQGTTKNTALIHSTTRNSTLSQGTTRNSGHVQSAPRNNVLTQGSPRHASIDRSTTYIQGTTRNLPLTQVTTQKPAFAVHSSPGHKPAPMAPVSRHGSGKMHGAWSRPSKAAAPAAAPATSAPTVTQPLVPVISSQPAAQHPSAFVEAHRGAPASRLPRYHSAPEPQPRPQPAPQCVEQPPASQQRARPRPEQFLAQQLLQVPQEVEQDQQQGKPLFSVLL